MNFFLKIIGQTPIELKVLGAGLLLGLSVLFPYASLLVLVGIFILLWSLLDARSLKRAVFLGWFAWFIKGLLVLSFLVSTYPITGYPIDNFSHQAGWILWSWLLGAFALSVGGGLFAGTFFILKKYFQPKLFFLFYVPAIWLVGELFSSVIYSILTLGAGSSVQAYFSMGYIGYALSGVPGYILFSKIAGVYGLSFLAVLWVGFWYLANSFWYRGIVIFLFCLLGFIGYGLNYKITSPDLPRVLTIDTFFPANSMEDTGFLDERRKVLTKAISEAQKYNADYIILPEDSRYLNLSSATKDIKSAYDIYRFLNSNSQVKIIDTARAPIAYSQDEAVLRSYIFSSTQTPVMSDKRYLTPQGEYLPYLTETLLKMIGKKDLLTHSSLGNYKVGELMTPKDYRGPVVLFCFESINPNSVRQLLKRQENTPIFVAHPVSHAWFNFDLLIEYQLDTMLSVQSVWNNVVIISAGNHTVGKTYLPNGSIKINREILREEGWVIREGG